MFIRSQDKYSLINLDLNNVRIEDGDDIKGVTRRIFSGHELLGKYDTVDRAIEVLDEIEKAYLNCNQPFLQYNPSSGTLEPMGGLVINSVFQMPED